VGTGTTVTATFNEAVQPGTISFVLKDASGNSVPGTGTVTYNSVTLTATFTPNAPLATSTKYTATVSATDVAGTPMAAPGIWSFTTLNVWQQSTAVQPAPGFSDNFPGTALSSAWTTTPWVSGGGATVSNNTLSVAGAEVLSTQTYSGVGVEASLDFAAAPYQHFGLATDLGAVAGNYWAIFSTMGTTNTLYARVNANGVTQDVSLGALPSGFHKYQVQPIPAGFQFYIDGVLQTTLSASIPSNAGLHIALSAYSTSGPGLQVASVQTLGGTFTSSVFNAGSTAVWGTATWTANLPAGTSMIVLTRSGNTATPDGTWSNWMAVTNGGTVASPDAQYLQYMVIFITTDPNLTPVLDNINFDWNLLSQA
jgi:hypothetical protein